jgi:hypothetical protein
VLTSAGVRERRRVYGRTRAEAHGKLTKLIRESQEGIPVAATSQTVGEYLRYWIKEVVPYRIRPLTFRTYEMVVREHLIPGLGRKRLSRLTARDVRLFLNSCRQTRSRSPGRSGQELSPRTIFHLHAVLRNALEHAVREDLLTQERGEAGADLPGSTLGGGVSHPGSGPSLACRGEGG